MFLPQAPGAVWSMRNRQYDPELGRFAQTDPIGISGGVNLYAYAGSDPGNAVDPWGLVPYPRISHYRCTVVIPPNVQPTDLLKVESCRPVMALFSDMDAGSGEGFFYQASMQDGVGVSDREYRARQCRRAREQVRATEGHARDFTRNSYRWGSESMLTFDRSRAFSDLEASNLTIAVGSGIAAGGQAVRADANLQSQAVGWIMTTAGGILASAGAYAANDASNEHSAYDARLAEIEACGR